VANSAIHQSRRHLHPLLPKLPVAWWWQAFEGIASQQAAFVDLCLASRAHVFNASLLTLALKFRCITETILQKVKAQTMHSWYYLAKTR